MMDLRQSPRSAVGMYVSFKGEGIDQKGKLFNLSLSGCGISSPKAPLVGHFVQLRLTLGDRPVEVEVAVVRWSLDGKFGVEFISVKPEFQAQLRQFMKTT